MTSVLIADPPWRFGDKLPGTSRGAERNYPTLSWQEIAKFPLPPLADDAHLFLWRVAAMQVEALHVVSAWGFTVKTEIVWCKQTSTGARWFGMGRHVRAEHEICLVATRGRPKVRSRSVRSTFAAPVVGHSAKPDAFYALVEELVGPGVELFARRQRPGWQCYGDELAEAHP